MLYDLVTCPHRVTNDLFGKPKKTYAAQLALYVDILERLGLAAGRIAYIWDVHGEEVPYKLDEPRTKMRFSNGRHYQS